MASPFASAGLGQFGQDLPSVSGAGGGAFLTALALQKTGVEDYLNKNFGATYADGRLAMMKPPANNAVAVPAKPNAENTTPANSVPPVVSQATNGSINPMSNFLDNSLEAINKTGSAILNGGKSIATFIQGQ
jgi:hypothetical protein